MGLFKRRGKDNSKSDSAQTGQGGYDQQNGYGYQQNGYGGYGYGYGGYGYPQGAPNPQDGQNGYGQNGYPGGYGYPGYGYPGYGYPGYGGYGYGGYGGYGPMSNYIESSYPQEDYGDPNAQAANGQAQQNTAAPQTDMANTKTAENNQTTNTAEGPAVQPEQPAPEPQPAPVQEPAQAAQPAPEPQPAPAQEPAQAPAPEQQPQEAQPQEPAHEQQAQQPQPPQTPPGESEASTFVDVDLSKFQGDDALKAEAEDLKRKWYAVTAEYENYRKRTANTRMEAYKEGRADVIKKLFPIGDNLDRAIKSCQDETTKKGIEMVLAAFAKLLESEDITVINPIGQPFDPKECEAIMAMDPQEGQESGIVLEVYVKGYKQGEKVLRYAQVIVTK